MTEVRISNPRKRQRTEHHPHRQNRVSQPRSKRQKLDYYSTKSRSQPAFWANLSKIWLTKSALRELDRRNSQPNPIPPHTSYPRVRGPSTRRTITELNKGRQTTQSATVFLRYCAPTCLKDIKKFARHGGPDLSDLKGYPDPVNPLDHRMSSSQSSCRGRKRDSTATQSTKPTPYTKETKSSGPYDRNFRQHLIDNGFYPHGYRYPDGRISAKPCNWDEIHQRLIQTRPSLSPSKFSEGAHEDFVQTDADASKEKQVSESVIPFIEGKIEDTKCRSGGIPLGNLDSLTGSKLKPGNPDVYYGARPEQLNGNIRDELSGYIIPSTEDSLLMTPNFFLTAKGPNGSAAVAKLQACYDGALGARGIHSLRSYEQNEPCYDNNAYTITSTYHNGQLQMYTSYPTQPASPGDRPEYHMHQVNGWSMTGNPETFRQGATAYRNARDWATEQRDEAIRQANKREGESQAATLALNASFGQVSRFASEAISEENYTLSQESQTLLTEDANTTANLQESETSIDELAVKRRSKRSRRS